MPILSPFDPAQPNPLDTTGTPILPEVQAPIPEPTPPAPPMGMVPPPVDNSLQGAPGAPPQPQDMGGPLQWPAPDWLHPDGLQPQDVPVVENPPPAPGQVAAGLNEEPMGPPADMAGSPPPPAPVNPDPAMAQADQNTREHEQALLNAAQAEQEKNAFLSSAGVQAANDAARRQTAADNAFVQANDEAKTKRAQLDKEAMAIANQQINPMRAWHDASFGAKLAMGIAVIVQGMATKGPIQKSPVVSMIQEMCAQDFKAQEENLANRTNALGVRRGLLADDMAAGRDMMDFQYKSLNAAYAMAENQIKAYALKYDNPIINASAQEKLAEIHDARLKLGMDWHNTTVEQNLKKQQVGIQGYEAQTGRMNAETARMAQQSKGSETSASLQRLAFDQQKDHDSRVINNVTYKSGSKREGDVLGPDDKVAGDVNAKLGLSTNFVQGIRRLRELQKKNRFVAFGKWGNDDVKEANTITEGLISDWSNAKGQGVVREGEFPRMQEMIGKVGGFLDSSRNMETLENVMEQEANNMLRQRVSPDVNYWSPPQTPGASPYFNAGAQPSKVPGQAGLPAEGRTLGQDPLMSPDSQEFIKSGKFKPTDPNSEQGSKSLLDYAGGG